jgi:hypothetical protein
VLKTIKSHLEKKNKKKRGKKHQTAANLMASDT